MRVGQNPAKNIATVSKPKRITVAVLSYVPFISGYYSEALDVLKLCLENIWQNTDLPYDLLVFDNGSCAETREYLIDSHTSGKIQYLTLSDKNIGKGGAWNFIFAGSPGEIIAYCDSDALLSPGWLCACVKILETYPNVGMVTARPMRTHMDLLTSTMKWGNNNPQVKVEKGKLISFDEFREFADTMGYSDTKVKQLYDTSQDVRFTYKELIAYAGANHFQFVTWKKTLNRFLPFHMDKPLGQVQILDKQLNEAGNLRLMTEKPLVQNMSNRLPKGMKAKPLSKERRGIKEFNFVKKPLLWLHDAIFRLYSDH